MSTKLKPGYKSSPFGPVPDDWSIQFLGNIVDPNRSIRYGIVQPGEFDPSGRYMIRGQDYSFGWVDRKDLFKVSDHIEEKYKKARVKSGDIILTIVGAGTGTVAVIPEWLEGANLTQTTARIAIDSKQAHPLFCYYFLQSSFGKKLTYQNVKGGAQPGLNCGDVENYQIALPSIDEQRCIVRQLLVWDEAISSQNQLIIKKQLRKKWLMQQLLTGKKRLKGFKGKWKECHLGDFFDERNETNQKNLPLLSIGQYGVYPQSDSIKKDTSNEDKSKYKRIRPGDIGYNTMRMWQGRSALSSLDGIVSPAYTILSPRKNADSLYFAYLFKTPKLVNSFYRNSQGLVEDTLNCKYPDFAIVKIVAPEKEEQKAIAKVLQLADKELTLLRQKLDRLKEQKKGFMQVLLTGKKRLRI